MPKVLATAEQVKNNATPPAAPAIKKPTAAPKVKEKPKEQAAIVYDKVSVDLAFGDKAITEAMAKAVLGWETEKEYAIRSVKANPGSTPDQWTFGESYMLKDHEGNKVQCWNNLDNRPFDEEWANGLCQTILAGQWAGPLTLPGETVNGSTIAISRTGKVESGQHSLVALVLAYQKWFADRKKYPFWQNSETGPVIETIVITGISEDPRVLMTVDNCKPRSESDVFYTSELFRKLVPSDRKECARMLAAGRKMLWDRTKTQGYGTHAEVMAFVERHPKLLKAIDHLFVENSARGGRRISNLKLSAGQCAGLLYLMGASASDGNEYRNGIPPTEKSLDWKHWDFAKEFWVYLGMCIQKGSRVQVKDGATDPEARKHAGKKGVVDSTAYVTGLGNTAAVTWEDKAVSEQTPVHQLTDMDGNRSRFQPVRTALARLVDSSAEDPNNLGQGGRTGEKFAIISKAWRAFIDGQNVFTDADLAPGGVLSLNYCDTDDQGNKLPDGRVKLLDTASFGGIDVPDTHATGGEEPDEPPPMTAEELEEQKRVSKEESRKAAMQKILDLRKQAKPAVAVAVGK